MDYRTSLETFAPQIGEIGQHSINVDKKLLETSEWYFDLIKNVLSRNNEVLVRRPLRFLEIASYRHIVGYMMAREYGAEATLFDLSREDLEAARTIALALGHEDNVELVSGDFHTLPFEDGYFDFVFISASIHHSRTPERVIQEAMRVLSDGGLFYSQREPCRRLFCYYAFLANRPHDYTPFERHLHEREMMRIFSSPFPGARNAMVFGRVENDLIPLQLYYDAYSKSGEIKEQVLYHEGLLTKLDKEILAQTPALDEPALAGFIEDRLNEEVALAAPLLREKERLLGFKLPNLAEKREMAARVAGALKLRPANEQSVEWQRAMAEIFGASVRFVVQRRLAPKPRKRSLFAAFRRSSEPSGRSEKKLKEGLRKSGHVYEDRGFYEKSGLELWNPLLPDIQTAAPEQLHGVMPESDWYLFKRGDGVTTMRNRTAPAQLTLRGEMLPAAAVIRYRPLLTDGEPLKVVFSYGSSVVAEEILAQVEDRLVKFMCHVPEQNIVIRIHTLDDEPVRRPNTLAISVLQLIPVAKSLSFEG